MIDKRYIIELLKNLNLNSGDSIMVHSSLKKLGQIKGIDSDDKNAYCQTIYKCFDEIIDIKNKGMLVVPTFTHDYVRKKETFILERSKSETGVFSEYIRNMNDSLRTLHPINSVAIKGGA